MLVFYMFFWKKKLNIDLLYFVKIVCLYDVWEGIKVSVFLFGDKGILRVFWEYFGLRG